MSNTINPYASSRSDLQRPVTPTEKEDDGQRPDQKKANIAQHGNGLNPSDNDSKTAHEKVEQAAKEEQTTNIDTGARTAGFSNTIGDAGASILSEGVADGSAPQPLEGLTPDEQQLIYRYFPESPSLNMRLYKPDMSTNKVDPGSVGSRVDIRG